MQGNIDLAVIGKWHVHKVRQLTAVPAHHAEHAPRRTTGNPECRHAAAGRLCRSMHQHVAPGRWPAFKHVYIMKALLLERHYEQQPGMYIFVMVLACWQGIQGAGSWKLSSAPMHAHCKLECGVNSGHLGDTEPLRDMASIQAYTWS